MKIILRTRLNGRIPDPQDKYRDEITQEATVELDIADYVIINQNADENLKAIIRQAEQEMKALKLSLYEELKRLGGRDYVA